MKNVLYGHTMPMMYKSSYSAGDRKGRALARLATCKAITISRQIWWVAEEQYADAVYIVVCKDPHGVPCRADILRASGVDHPGYEYVGPMISDLRRVWEESDVDYGSVCSGIANGTVENLYIWLQYAGYNSDKNDVKKRIRLVQSCISDFSPARQMLNTDYTKTYGETGYAGLSARYNGLPGAEEEEEERKKNYVKREGYLS